MTSGEEYMGGRTNSSNIENALEAIIGAIYIDGGLAAAHSFISKHWDGLFNGMTEPPRDTKTALQEWAQGRGLEPPAYIEIGRTGPDHAPEFTIAIKLSGFSELTATGPSKKLAEHKAAEAFLVRERVWQAAS